MIVFSFILAFFFVYMFWYIVPSSESSSRTFGRSLNRRLSLITRACRTDDKTLYFESKAKTFKIEIKNAEVAPGLAYDTIPVYTCKDVYIDNELVCKVHRLERLFTKAYLAEFSRKRRESEVLELINAAYKKAKQLDKEYWKAWYAKQDKENSFYDTKKD